jgi:hypothetical protein
LNPDVHRPATFLQTTWLVIPTTNTPVITRVRLLNFSTLGCGCVIGRYREVSTNQEIVYVEEKGSSCGSHSHRRNQTWLPTSLLETPPAATPEMP